MFAAAVMARAPLVVTAAAPFMVAAAAFMGMGCIVMAALDVWIVGEASLKQGLDGRIGISRNAAVQPDSGFRERLLCAASNSTADQCIDLQGAKEGRQRPMPAADNVDNFGRQDLLPVDVIELELLGMTEMLKNLSVLVGNCNSHDIFSFWCLKSLTRLSLATLLPSAEGVSPVTEPVFAPFDPKRETVDQNIRHLFAGSFVDLLHRRAGDLHLAAALFL